MRRGSSIIAPTAFALLTFVMFFDVLFSSARVLSSASTDLALQFIPWRQFGFEQIRAGNFPLWNPHIFGGTPYFAGFQSALLYPPNWLHLILPAGVAINWIIAIHVFCAGYFTCLWCRRRDISIGGSILAGMMFMFCGPYFMHIYAGHLPHLAAMVWAPLILLSLDGLADGGQWRWVLLGSIAVTMQILAGHPQYVYYTSMALAIYVALRINRRHGIRLVAGFFLIYFVGAALSAVQLLPGIALNAESVRGTRTAYEFASTFALLPRNLITLLAPGFFGSVPMNSDAQSFVSYWGAGYLWEMCLFFSLTGLVLALFGAIAGRIPGKWSAVGMVGVALLFALGRHTPVYRLMYEYVPQYGALRGTVKFAYLGVLFVALLAGCGFDAMRQTRRVAWALPSAVFVGCVVALLFAWWIARSSAQGADGAWGSSLQSLAAKYSAARELFTHRVEEYRQDDFIRVTGRTAARSLCWAAVVGTAILVIAIASRFRSIARYGFILLAVVELFAFARSTRATLDFAAATALPAPWRQPVAQLAKDERLLTVPATYANLGMSLGFDNLAGYDPGVLRRYAELIHASQDVDPLLATQYLPFRRVSPAMFRMLRCGLVCFDPTQAPIRLADPLPVAILVGYWVVPQSRDARFAYLLKENFDPRVAVVLESDPGISLSDASAAGGSVEILAMTPNLVELRARLARPAILLITNNFADGWRVRSYSPSPPQAAYTLVPANHTLQGIPLHAGDHHLRLEYAPAPFRIGLGISIGTVLTMAAILCVAGFRRRHPPAT